MKRFNLLIVATLVLFTFSLGGLGAQAQDFGGINTKNIVKRGFSQLFTYDPTNSGTVAVSYVNHYHRLAALLVQPHTVKKTACGYLFQGLQGLPLSTARYSIDISTDTIVSQKANLILIGIDQNGVSRVHQALGLNFDSSFPSDPGWNTFNYSANTFSPPIGSTETLSSFAISLFGGTTTPPDHFDHFLSHPVINGVNVLELVDHSVVVTDGRLVGF
jgi:hypothetical protein